MGGLGLEAVGLTVPLVEGMESFTKGAVDMIWWEVHLEHSLDLESALVVGVVEEGPGVGKEVRMKTLAGERQGYCVVGLEIVKYTQYYIQREVNEFRVWLVWRA